MSSLRSLLRRSAERVPLMAETYRDARARLAYRRAATEPTRYGFELVGSSAAARGELEADEAALIASNVDPGTVLVDVGANAGFYACLGASRGGHVVAIEPLPENLAYLYRNLDTNGFSGVEVFPMAVSEAPGLLALYGGSTGASLVRGWAGASTRYRTMASASTLDILVGNRFDGRRLVVKIDVEGAELAVLRGAGSLLRAKPRPFWLVEISLSEHHPSGFNPRFAETFELFWSLGYSARTTDKDAKPISRAEVASWVASGVCGSAGHNFVFC